MTLKGNKVTRLYMSVHLSNPGSRSRQMGIVSWDYPGINNQTTSPKQGGGEKKTEGGEGGGG